MIQFDDRVWAHFSKAYLLETLDEKFRRDVPRFADGDEETRGEFLVLATHFAEAAGFRSARGIASYAIACWWLGYEFEQKSPRLSALLAEKRPEFVRRNVMNEWVGHFIGTDGDLEIADASIDGNAADAETLV